MLVDGVERLYYLGADSSTHPEYRGRGIYNQMRDFENERASAWADGTFTVTRNPGVLRRVERLGLDLARTAAPRVLVRVFNPKALARLRATAGSSTPEVVLHGALTAHRLGGFLQRASKRTPSEEWALARVERFDGGFDELFEDAAQAFRFIKIRSAHYLAWRYLDSRGGEYETYAAFAEGAVLGYIALKIENDRGYILDILARPERDDVVRSLLRRAAARFKQAHLTAAECWIPPSHPYRRLLRRSGYFDTRRVSGTLVTSLPGHEQDLEFFKDKDPKVHLMLGDVDNV